MSATEVLERDRFFSRLATIPGVHPMPSIGDWILLKASRGMKLERLVEALR